MVSTEVLARVISEWVGVDNSKEAEKVICSNLGIETREVVVTQYFVGDNYLGNDWDNSLAEVFGQVYDEVDEYDLMEIIKELDIPEECLKEEGITMEDLGDDS